MSYSVNTTTKIATYEGQEYYPNAVAKGGTTVLVAMTEDECKEMKKIRDNFPNVQLQDLRIHRNMLIAQTDWWASADLTMTDAQKTYRQALRDITKTYKTLDRAQGNWPIKPE